MRIKGLYHMPGSKFYWYRWQSNGKRNAVSLKTDDLAEAIKKVESIQAGEAFARWERAEPVPTSASKSVDDYLKKAQLRNKKPMRARTARKQRAVLVKFLKDSRVEHINQITAQSIQAWLGSLLASGSSKDTAHTYARVLKTFVGYLVANKMTLVDLAKFDVPERAASGRKNWLKLEVANRVIADSKYPNLTFVLFCGFHAGLRKSEIIAAKVGWFDLESGLLHVQNDPASGFVLKDRECRTIPLTPDFKNFLQGYLAGKESNTYALHPEATGNGEYRTDFRRAFTTHMRRRGVICSIHDMRRSFASNLVSRGISIYKVARWLGDGVPVVERSYGHLSPADRDVDILSTQV